jgi:hypothetical protein
MNEFIIIIALASLAIQTSYHSSLAYQIKDFLYLSEYKLKTIEILSKFGTWKAVGLWWLSPLIIPMFIWHKLGELLNCQYCTSFWYGFLWFISTNTIQISILYGGLTIIAVMLIEKLFIK